LLLWAVQIVLVQEQTLVLRHAHGPGFELVNSAIRFGLTLLACVAALLLLPRLVLVVVFLLCDTLLLGLMLYTGYFDQSLSAFTIVNQSSIGMMAAPMVIDLLAPVHGAFVVAFAAKVALLFFQGPKPKGSLRRRRRLIGLGVVAAYAVAFIALNLTRFPLGRLAADEPPSCAAQIYGYVPTWAGELILVDPASLMGRSTVIPDIPSRLIGVEAPLEIEAGLVFIQVESLDYAVLDYFHGDVEVTPRLNQIARSGMLYKLKSPHGNGSGDADFMALMAQAPTEGMVNYFIPGQPYERALPHRLRELGYKSAGFHGCLGRGYQRRPAWVEMGFDGIYFREDLQELIDAETGHWGYWDSDVLGFMESEWTTLGERFFMFVITVSSHGPFDLPPHLRKLYPEPSSRIQRYFNAINHVDEAIGSLVDSLPDGTTFLIYSDHGGYEDGEGYEQLWCGDYFCTPAIIYTKGSDLSELQATADEGGLAMSGELYLLEVVRFVYHTLFDGVVSADGTEHREWAGPETE